jgi:hypothetical protein
MEFYNFPTEFIYGFYMILSPPSGGKLQYRHRSPGGITGPHCHCRTQKQSPDIPNFCLEDRLTTFLCKEITVAKPEEMETE